MENEITQEELSPEEAKASLGLSTRLSEEFLMSQAPQDKTEEAPVEASQEASQAPTSPVEPEVEEKPVEEENIGIEAIQNAVKEAVQEEMKGLKKDIEKVINEDKDN